MPTLCLQFLDDAGDWIDVSAHTNFTMLGRVANGHLTGDDGHYRYDLWTMRQSNPRTGRVRALRLRSDRSDIPAWMFMDDSNTPRLSVGLSHAMHARWEAGLYDLDGFQLHMGFETYMIYVNDGNGNVAGVQVNCDTGTRRQIFQHPMGATLDDVQQAMQPPPPPPPQPQYVLPPGIEESEEDDEDDSSAPDELCCPITHRIMQHPVIATDGKVYEESAIRCWFARRQSSPLTGLPLTDPTLQVHMPTLLAIKSFRSSAEHAPMTADGDDAAGNV